MRFVDTHAHLDFAQFAGEEVPVLSAATAAGVDRIITVGTTLKRSRQAVSLAERFPNVWAAVGIHPHDAGEVDDRAVSELHELAGHPKVVAIGEFGFDFHYDDGPDERTQSKAFLQQSVVAADRDLPLILHSRDAEATTIRHLQRLREHWQREVPGVVHCFTGTAPFAEVALELGFYISFTAPLSYPKNDELRQVAKTIPLEKTLLETDCPFLPPPDQRGQRNEPAFLVSTAEALAKVHGVSLEEVAKVTTANAERVFGLT